MGEVFRARDPRLGRDVAIKVLPAAMSTDPDRLARFQREARAVAALNHPHIVTIYSVEEAGSIHFLTMELVEGKPLDRIIPARGLPADQIVDIGSALADALSAAHDKGIVHRDLKPANVMVNNEGRVKVLDFGLAKEVTQLGPEDETRAAAGNTQAGMVMGTPAYMSPEQISARPLDHRTDIFSLGVVLHEMATGKRPFAGHSSAELISSVLRDTPPSVCDIRADLPSDLARIIRRCLEKDPRYRIQTARDVSNEFRDLARQTQQKAASPTSARAPASSHAATPSPTSAAHSRTDSGTARADEGFWVAVLPFKAQGVNPDLAALAEGLTEDIVTGMSRFSYLRVIARGSTLSYANKAIDLRVAGKELGARYVMEGTLRQAGAKLRLAVQLVDTVTGAHLWAENYERAFSPESIFELQDDLVPRIVSTVADNNGALPRSMSEAVHSKAPEELSPYEAVLRSFAYFERYTPEELSASRSGLEAAVRKAPAYADAWAMLASLCAQDYLHGYELQENALESAASAARKAVELSPTSHLAYFSLAQVLAHQKDFDSFQDAAERVLALNPMDGNAVAFLGEFLVYGGNAERGMQLVERAKQLNPNHPGFYWFADFYQAFSQKDYRGALAFAQKARLRGNPLAPMMIASAAGQLGDGDTAAKAAADLLKFRPELPALMPRQAANIWNPEYGERFLDGLRKAGLDIPEAGATADRKSATKPTSSRLDAGVVPVSGATRADDGFWIAVLPFKSIGASPEIATLADGLGEEIVTALSRFSYLRVLSQSSSTRQARYVMESSIRQSGSTLRLAVQLVDKTTGTHIWAETYDRPFQSDDLFAVQDELVLRIVSTVADQHGVLPHSIASAIRGKSSDQLSPYETVLRVFSFHERMTPEEHAELRDVLERIVKITPGESDCWAMLATLYSDEHMFGFQGPPDPLGRATAAARRAVELAPSSALALQAVSQSLFYRKEFTAFRPVAERALLQNRADGALKAFLGMLIAFSGEWDRGCALVDGALRLNPHHPGWYWVPAAVNAYRKRDYRASIEASRTINMPGYFWGPFTSAASYGQLGEPDAARKALKELLEIRPDFAEVVRFEIGKWFDSDLVEHFVEGLSKAGLAVGGSSAVAGPSGEAGAARTSGAAHTDEGFWVAVLPFKSGGTNPELAAFAEGLSEEIITGLSRFSYLRVIARGSTLKYANQPADIRTAGKELGARYVMEGTLRQAGAKLRLAVQLVDTVTGAHLWAENYERAFSSESIFELQDDLVPRIVSTVADNNGALPRSMSEAVHSKAPEELSPYEAVLRSFAYFERYTPEELSASRSGLEAAVRKAPAYADAWAMLACLCAQDYLHGYELQKNALESAASAARKAVELSPTSHLAYFSLAQVLAHQKDFDSFQDAAERVLALNPMDGNAVAFLGEFLVYGGNAERGMQLAERAKQLNPNHPGFYWFADFYHAFSQKDYRGALAFAQKAKLRGNPLAPMMIASAAGKLGDGETAAKAAGDLLKFRPELPAMLRRQVAKVWNPEYAERFLDGLHKAGIEIPEAGATADQKSATKRTSSRLDAGAVPVSGATRADEGFWIAVLPFKSLGASPEVATLADGLGEEIVTGLSRFSYLRVIARSSTSRYSQGGVDVRTAGHELGARYVMEGSLRQAGSKLRLSVQLVDGITGAHLWAENYERAFSPDAFFELQDDLVPRIVSTVADTQGILPRTMSDILRTRNPSDLSPYEAVLRSFAHFQRVNAEEHAASRAALERAVEVQPGYGDAWAMLSLICKEEFTHELNLRPDPLGRAMAAALRAVEAAPSNHLAFHALAMANYFLGDRPAFRSAAERALELNPMDGFSIAFLGSFIAYDGDWEYGCRLSAKARSLNPHHPGWYWFVPCFDAYRKGDYRLSLEFARKVNMPSLWRTSAVMAAALGQLGEIESARILLQTLLTRRPNFQAEARKDLAIFWGPDLVEGMIEGLRKAGLEIADRQTPAPSRLPSQSGAKLTAATPSLAVLPFANLSAEKDQEYFSDGLAEEIINLLAQISGLKVIARTSAFAFRGKEEDIRGIADALGVTTILQGSVRRAGNRIRVTVQLINASDGAHLWSERYHSEMTDVFVVQDEIAAAIAGALQVKLSAPPREYVPQLAAYEEFLKARHHLQRWTPESAARGRECLERAVGFDPGFALAHSELGWCYYILAIENQIPPGDAAESMRATARKALGIESSLPDAHAVLAMAGILDYDWSEAGRQFQLAMASERIQPFICYLHSAFYLVALGRMREAEQGVERALQEDPLNALCRAALGSYRLASGRFAEGEAILRDALQLDENFWIAQSWMGFSCLKQNRMTEAIAYEEKARSLAPWNPTVIGRLAGMHERAGEKSRAQALLEELGSGTALGVPGGFLCYHSVLADVDSAAGWYEKAIEQRDPRAPWLFPMQFGDLLTSSPRWPDLMRRMNLPAAAG